MLRRADRWTLVRILGLIVVASLGATLQSLALRWMIDGAAGGRSRFAYGAAALGALAAGINAAGGRAYGNLQDLLTARLRIELDRETLSLVAGMPGIEQLERPAYLDQVHLVSESGGHLLRSVFTITDLVMLALRILIGVWLLATVHPVLVLIPVFAVPSVLLTGRQQRISEQAAVRTAAPRRSADGLHRLFTQGPAAMEMRVFGAVEALDARADELWNETAKAKLSGALRSAGVAAIGWSILALGYAAALLTVALLAERGRATPGDVVMVSQLALQLRANVAQTTLSVRQALGALRLADRFVWLHDQAADQRRRYAGTTAPPHELNDGIRLRNVSFAYPDSATPVLRNVDLELPAGSVVALVGPNGAGKSTLV
jgi:ATP-binding cassette subfamily B protein